MYLQMIHFHWNQFKKEIYYFGRYSCGCIADVFMAFAVGRKVDDGVRTGGVEGWGRHRPIWQEGVGGCQLCSWMKIMRAASEFFQRYFESQGLGIFQLVVTDSSFIFEYLNLNKVNNLFFGDGRVLSWKNDWVIVESEFSDFPVYSKLCERYGDAMHPKSIDCSAFHMNW